MGEVAATGVDGAARPGAADSPAGVLRAGVRRVVVAARASDGGLLVMALVVGAGAGGGAVLFRWLIRVFTLALSGHADYSIAGHAANPHLPGLGRWFVVLAPVVAGLLYGPLVQFFAREARGHGVPEVMYAVARRGGRIAPQVAAVKSLASALCIGGGGSVGREGPIVQIGSALGSSLGLLARVSEERMRVLVSCGAAGGIAATFNAPLAGVFFAMELILRDFAARSFGMVVLSSVTASVIGRAALGSAPFLHLPTFTVQHPLQYLLFAGLGLLAGGVGVLFTRILYLVEDVCDRAWRGRPEWLRPAVGGVLLGGLLLVLPEMYGVGYPVLDRSVADRYTIAFLVALLFGKILATSLTIGIGGSGGVFAPSLFIGAALGDAYGQLLHHAGPGITGAPGAFAMIGMGAVFAGAAQAPITAVVIMFELTGDYAIILPLMTAIVLATGVSHLFTRETIYTLKLVRRGVTLEAPPPPAGLTSIHADQILEPAADPLPVDATLHQASAALASSRHGILAVADADGRYLGVVSAVGLTDTLAAGTADSTTVDTVLQTPPTVRTATPLAETLAALGIADAGAVPVLDSERRLAGWLTPQRVLAALHPSPPALPPPRTGPRRVRHTGTRTRPRAPATGTAPTQARATSTIAPGSTQDPKPILKEPTVSDAADPRTRWARAGAAVLRTRWLVRAPIWLFRARLGFLFGRRLLMLDHTGRSSGRRRYVVLEVVDHAEPGRYIVVSGFGVRAQWYRNVQANPRVRVWVGARGPAAASVRDLEPEEAARTLRRYAVVHPRAWGRLRPVLEATLGARLDESGTELPMLSLEVSNPATPGS